MKTTVKTDYIAPKVYVEGNFCSAICTGSGNASYGVGFEGITVGDEIDFD